MRCPYTRLDRFRRRLLFGTEERGWRRGGGGEGGGEGVVGQAYVYTMEVIA